ncbi:hypothetical protein CEXT_611341 [Caerostris extrusa]|uniref:Uncharacterized protein n=1 Tax=Caerostris extrusa TaxID=172846 RepID=A0AAV4MHS2_CAEEX|nr:hypothetical protein CEXT_611341 [Caerostris extrusa]
MQFDEGSTSSYYPLPCVILGRSFPSEKLGKVGPDGCLLRRKRGDGKSKTFDLVSRLPTELRIREEVVKSDLDFKMLRVETTEKFIDLSMFCQRSQINLLGL